MVNNQTLSGAFTLPKIPLITGNPSGGVTGAAS